MKRDSIAMHLQFFCPHCASCQTDPRAKGQLTCTGQVEVNTISRTYICKYVSKMLDLAYVNPEIPGHPKHEGHAQSKLAICQ